MKQKHTCRAQMEYTPEELAMALGHEGGKIVEVMTDSKDNAITGIRLTVEWDIAQSGKPKSKLHSCEKD